MKIVKNRKQKGSRNELKCKHELEEQGYLVEKVRYGGKFMKSVDFFGVWDILALRNGNLKFIQVKTNKKPVMKIFEEFAVKNWASNFDFEVWVYRDRKTCRKFIYSSNEFKMKELKI